MKKPTNLLTVTLIICVILLGFWLWYLFSLQTLNAVIYLQILITLGFNLFLLYVWKYKSTRDFYQCVPFVCIQDVWFIVLCYIIL